MRRILLTSVAGLGLLVGTANAIVYDLLLDSSQSVPSPNLGGATPSGTATVDVNTLTGDVSVSGNYTGLTSDTSATHLHGLAGPGAGAGVLFGLTVDGGTAGNFTGNGSLSASNLAGLLAGQTYVNLHTTNNGPSEIRAQVVDNDIRVFQIGLDPGQAVPAPGLMGATPAGQAIVVVDASTGDVEISGTYSGVTSAVTAAHLHGLAGPGAATGVIFGFSVDGGTTGNFSGASTLSADNLAGLLAGNTYLNVHTSNNGPGEIRGQVVPEPSSLVVLLAGAFALIVAGRRKS